LIPKADPTMARRENNRGEETVDRITINSITKSTTWLTLLLALLLLSMGAHARRVWRKIDRRIVTGNEDVAFYLHFPLPCRKGRSLYNDSRMPRKFNVTEKFNLWCETFTNSIVDEGLTKMCSDTTSRVPSMARQLSLELTQAEQIQGLD